MLRLGQALWAHNVLRFLSYRQSYAHHPLSRSKYGGSAGNGYSDNDEERRGLISGDQDGDAIIEMDVLPPRWLDIQDQVTDTLDEISRKTVKLDSLHNKHVLPGFEDESVKQKEEREIERMTQDITRSFQQCQHSIRRVENMIKELKAGRGVSRAEETMARNLQISLASKVGEVSAVFRKKQSSYLKKLRQLNGMATPMDRSSPAITSSPYADPALLESDADRSLSNTTLQQTAQKRRSNNDSTIAQREKEIEDIAQGIIELANIFQELQTMVIDQGTMLDRIDYNIDRTAVDVKAADKELTVATGYQKRTTKRKIIFLLILIIAGLIILLAIKPKRRTKEVEVETPAPGPPPPASPAVPP